MTRGRPPISAQGLNSDEDMYRKWVAVPAARLVRVGYRHLFPNQVDFGKAEAVGGNRMPVPL